MVFTYFGYYPSGGMNDFFDSFDELDVAIEQGNIETKKDHYNTKILQIYDTVIGRIIE